MAAIIYGKIRSGLSPPYYDDILGCWGFPYASVSWESHYNQLTDLGKTFKTEEEAISFDFYKPKTQHGTHPGREETGHYCRS